MGAPPHPPLHHRHLVHLGRRQARVEALLAWDGAESGGTTAGPARPEGELATATVLPVACLLRQFSLVCVLFYTVDVMCHDTYVMCLIMCCVFLSSYHPNALQCLIVTLLLFSDPINPLLLRIHGDELGHELLLPECQDQWMKGSACSACNS